MEARRAAEAFPPGDFLREELEARGWTQVELAEILGRSERLVSEILSAKRSITPETARGLAEAFGTSAEYWVNLESYYQLWRSRSSGDSGIAKRARLYSKAPIREMIRRRWIEPSDSVDVLEGNVRAFLGIETLDEEPPLLAHAARKSTSYSDVTPAQVAWLCRARHLASAVTCGRFSQERLSEAVRQLQARLGNPEEVTHIPRILADAGIRFLIIEPLQHTRIDGACFWLDAKSPVVVLSMRFDRIDYFWYTLMHEISHVMNKAGQNGVTLDADLVGENGESIQQQHKAELEANRFAAETLIPRSELDRFIARVKPLYSKAKILSFANEISVHPGIVVGQLQHRGEIRYAHSRDSLVKVRSTVTQAALTDGWGSMLETA